MRIIDWSSDVCSSDLLRAAPGGGRLFAATWHTLTPTPLPLRRRGAGVPRPATTLCYSSPDGAPRHRVPLERPHARPRADGDVLRFLWRRFLDDRLFESAGALSFTRVFAMVRLSMVVFGVLSAFPGF